jgi:hypothetical protein
MNESITIAFSTRKLNEDYLHHIKKTCGLDAEILSFENNAQRSLTEIYNEVIDVSKNDIIVFCHDDLIFEQKDWGKKLLSHFNNTDYGIIGVAGSNNLVDGMWWSIRESMHGVVCHSDGNKKWITNFSKNQGDEIKQMIVLDGLFFAIDRNKIKNKFDTDFKGFHFYDIPFCFKNHLEGVKIGVITNILITHLSVGGVNQSWLDNKTLFEKKYFDKIPLKI